MIINNKKIIGITVGDPAGIGIEIAVKVSLLDKVLHTAIPILIGNSFLIQDYIDKYFSNKKILINNIRSCRDVIYYVPTKKKVINVYNASGLKQNIIQLGKASKESGKESIKYLEASLDLINKKIISAVVTCPISKKAIELAGYNFPGHTEFFAEKTNTKKYLMAFYSKDLKVALVSRHIALKDVSSYITKEKITEVIDLINININNPKIAVCGLNPHAGEQGVIGKEEEDIIIPAINEAKNKGVDIHGPFPAAT